MNSSPETGEPTWEPHLKEQSQDIERVRSNLQDWMRDALDDPDLRLEGLRPPAGTGVANETILFDAHRSTGEHAGAPEGYVARLATPDSLYLDYDIEQHYRMYETFTRIDTVPTPGVVGYEPDPGRLGAPFFVMEKIDGDIPTDMPQWTAEGFVFDASPADRRKLWESTIRVMGRLHQVDPEPFSFLRTGATDSGVGDSLDYWTRSLAWASQSGAGSSGALPLVETCAEWLWANLPAGITSLSWGDSRLPNVIYRDFTPVGLLDWDLVSLAGPQADLGWWILMDDQADITLEGIGTPDELVDIWQDETGWKADNLHWYLVYNAYRLAAIFSRLFGMMVVRGQMTEADARDQIERGRLAAQLYGLLDLTPPSGIEPRIPKVKL